MDENLVDFITENINDNKKLNKNVDAFFQLSLEDKAQLLNKISKIKTHETGRFLNLIYEKEGQKDIQKLIRKAIHILKTAGVDVDKPAIKGTSVIRRLEESKPSMGYITNYDENNEMIALIALHIKGNDYLFMDAYIQYLKGLIELNTILIKKSEVDDYLNTGKQNISNYLVITEVSPKYAHYVINEASSQSGKYREEVIEVNKFLGRLKYNIEKPEDIYNLPVPDYINTTKMDDVFNHRFFKTFFIEWDGIEEELKRYDYIITPSIVLPQYIIEENKQKFFNELLKSQKIKKTVPIFKKTLEHYALIFHCHKEYEYYRGLMEILKSNDTIEDAMLFWIEKALKSRYEEKEKDERKNSLIINPYEKERT